MGSIGPLGGFLPWWRPDNSPIPQCFEPADGTTVTTNFSPYYGQTKPDMRNRKSWAHRTRATSASSAAAERCGQGQPYFAIRDDPRPHLRRPHLQLCEPEDATGLQQQREGVVRARSSHGGRM